MKERETFPGKTYAVTSPNGCLVTKLDGNPILTLKPGIQDYFVAPAGKALLTDDEADVTESFEGIHTVALKAETEANKAMRSAMDSATAAATSATQAAESAAQLGDAALKSADNTFTGKNIFNGALGGTGTLYGLPMGDWLGISHMTKNVELTTEEFKVLFPNHKDIEVLPYLNCSRINFNGLFPNLKYAFFEIVHANAFYNNIPEGIPCRLKECWIYCGATSLWLNGFNAPGEKTYMLLPNYNESVRTGVIFNNAPSKTHKIVVYAPKWETFRIRGRWDSTYQHYSILEYVCNPAPVKQLIISGTYNLSFVNVNLQNCILVSVTDTRLDKASILTMVNTLPSYDESTMTTIPTCTMYVSEEFEGDEEIKNALLNLQAPVADGGKGWTIAISGITLTEAATFGLRKMWYVAKEKDDAGKYVDGENQRWSVSAGTVAMRHYVTNESIGYEQFASLDEAMTEWGLTEYMVIPDEDLTEQTEQ